MRRLVYASLAFTAIALIALVIAGSRQQRGYHGTTNAMFDALHGGATVLAADARGAVTQTGNGRVAGYERSGSRSWSISFDRFEADAATGYLPIAGDAIAWCAGSCPAAVVRIGKAYHAAGGAGDRLAQAFASLQPANNDVLSVSSPSQAWLRTNVMGGRRPGLLALTGARSQSVPVPGPQVVTPASGGRSVLVAAANGDVGALARFVRWNGRWRGGGGEIAERGLQNACYSPDGDWIGTVSDRIRTFRSDGTELSEARQVVSGGTCTIDGAGMTVVTNPAGSPNSLKVTRYTLRAVPLWMRYLGTQRLLSRSNARLVVAFSPRSVLTALDTRSGAVVVKRRLGLPPFVGADGSVVVAGRNGAPVWLAAPPSISSASVAPTGVSAPAP